MGSLCYVGGFGIVERGRGTAPGGDIAQIEVQRRPTHHFTMGLSYKTDSQVDQLLSSAIDGRRCPRLASVRDGVAASGAPFVYTLMAGAASGAIWSAVERRRGVAIIRGEKGVGKSVATLYALCELSGALTNDGKYRVLPVDASKVNTGGIEDAIVRLNKLGYFPVFYLDASPVGAYDGQVYEPAMDLFVFAHDLYRLGMAVSYTDAVLVAVMSNDQFNALDAFGDVVLDTDTFMAMGAVKRFIETKYGLESSYSIATEVARRFKGEYYWVAAITVAEALRRGLSFEDAMSAAEAMVYSYAMEYIWKHVLGGDRRTAERHAPLALAVGLGLDVDGAVRFVESRSYVDVHILRWFKSLTPGMLRSALEKAAKSAVYMALGFEQDGPCAKGAKSCELIHIMSNFLRGIATR